VSEGEPGNFRRRRRSTRAAPGTSPGTLIAHAHARAPTVRLMAYGPEGFEESVLAGVAELAQVKAAMARLPVVWVDVDGLADLALVQALGEAFRLHALALEDAVNTHQRPKLELYADHLFIVTRMIHPARAPATEQLAMFLGADYLLTFQDQPGDCMEPVRERIRQGRGRLRGSGVDYLAYALLDAAVDGYFPVLETYGERLETLEATIGAEGGPAQIRAIHALKRDLLTLRRAIWPQRELLHQLARDSGAWVSDATRIFLRDCYDHVIQLTDVVETYREIASGLVDLHLSALNVRMNEIIKVLTVIATIFMPLGFIASLYGMNFDPAASPWNMPELGWRFGYPFALLLMAAVAGGLMVYFRRQGWIGRRAGRR